MTLTDRQPWLQARKRIFWCGWPQQTIRFLLTSAVLCFAGNAWPLLFAQSVSSVSGPQGIGRLVSKCQQFRTDIEARMHAARSTNSPEQDSSTADTSIPDGINWTVDSQGRHWAFDSAEQAWRHKP